MIRPIFGCIIISVEALLDVQAGVLLDAFLVPKELDFAEIKQIGQHAILVDLCLIRNWALLQCSKKVNSCPACRKDLSECYRVAGISYTT